MKKRMAIFVFYDKDNIVDEYVYFLLKEIKKEVSYLVVVCNGYISEEDNHRMREYAEDIFERDNIGYDAGAIKDVILDYVGIEKIKEYEELLITNDTIYGPLYPLSEVFEKMEQEDVDFWGLTQVDGTEYSYLQSYFLVVRNKMLHSMDFVQFWEQMKYYKELEDVLRFYEQGFTLFFMERGYFFSSYVDTCPYSHQGEIFALNPYYHIFEESMSRERKLPFLKRKPMANKKLFQTNHNGILFENYIEVIRNIAKQQFFDFNMVWDNLLRVYPLHDIQKGCNLTYVLDTDAKKSSGMRDVLLIVHIETEQFLSKLIEKCNDFVKIVDVWVFASDFLLQRLRTELLPAVRIVLSNRNIDSLAYSNITESNGDYRYICWLDTRDYMQEELSYEERKVRYLCYIDNLNKSEGSIACARNLLENNERLGMLFPPQIFEKQMQEKGESNHQLLNYCKKLGLVVALSEERTFMNNIHSFWVKSELFNAFFRLLQRRNVCLEDFERGLVGEMLAYYAQTMGYYTGVVKRKEYAIVDAAMKEEYLFEMMELLENLSGRKTYFEQRLILKDKILVNEKIVPFIQNHKRVYVYGTGEVAKRLAPMLPGVAGFIVSDGHSKGKYLYNMPIIYFSEYKYKPGDGIFLALNYNNGRQVMEMFEKQNLTVDILPYQL